jgi:adenosine deaminase
LRRFHFLNFLFVIAVSSGLALAQSQGATPEQRANRYLESVRHQPLLALAFLREMPKGGDLHNHLGGAVYAEDLIDYAVRDKLCLDRSTMTAISGDCDSSCGTNAQKPPAECAEHDHNFYNTIVDAWSMRNWERGHESGHDHFFATFGKFDLPFHNHIGDEIALALQHAAADHLQYVELMHTVGGMQSAQLGESVGWNSDFGVMRDRLMSGGMKEAVEAARKELDQDEATVRKTLGCGKNLKVGEQQSDGRDGSRSTSGEAPASGCDVTVRYLYQVLRGFRPEQVFAQILMGFELASVDQRVVGLNLVMPEDWYVPMRDFNLHMKMLDYLHGIYPKVHISLHAGELTPGLVPPEGLNFHIRESIEVGHAERIGHGVDVMNEHNAIDLLREMAQRKILVEICLTSNDEILGVSGDQHPLPIYRKFGVPVALATDDEGVSRSDLTHDYLRAVETYGLSYMDLKQMARESLEHCFLPGASIWEDVDHLRLVSACAANRTPSTGCKKFLFENEKARVQWKLEQEFAAFEKKF